MKGVALCRLSRAHGPHPKRDAGCVACGAFPNSHWLTLNYFFVKDAMGALRAPEGWVCTYVCYMPLSHGCCALLPSSLGVSGARERGSMLDDKRSPSTRPQSVTSLSYDGPLDWFHRYPSFNRVNAAPAPRIRPRIPDAPVLFLKVFLCI
jgi:hypothetical protein